MKNKLFSMLKLNLMLLLFCTSISFAQVENKSDYTIQIIEDIPKFPNCINETNNNIEISKECFFQEMNNHIKTYFNYPKIAKKKRIQGRVIVKFIISNEGNVTNIETSAPNGCELLEKEAVRIIKLLPKFKPGEQLGKPVAVSYSQPINFKLN